MDLFKPRKDGKPLTSDTPESIAREKAEGEKRIQGKITRIDPKGYGFAISNELPFERIFFHWLSLRNDTLRFPELQRGMRIEFVARDQGIDPVTHKRKGFKAIRIEVIDKTIDTSDLEDELEDESTS